MTNVRSYPEGYAKLRAAMNSGRSLFVYVAAFSCFVNLLMLTGPLFMLQIYDRVLASRSEATLTALCLLAAFLYLIMGVLDYARGRVLARAGAEFQTTLDQPVFEAVLQRSIIPNKWGRPASGLQDLEAVQRVLSSPAIFAVFDIPWVPIFLGVIYIFHPVLGFVGLVGGAILILFTALNQMVTKASVNDANREAAKAQSFADYVRQEGEVVLGLGMRGAVLERWQIDRNKALSKTIRSSDRTGIFQASSKTFRFFLQSAMLGVGAYLVLQNELTPGAMIAGSILLGRALAPIDQAIGQWPSIIRAQQGWNSLGELLETSPEAPPRTELPKPQALLEAHQLAVIPPDGKVASLQRVSFRLEPGQALGVIGPSASGKSTLARAITGLWPLAAGELRLDGASLDNYASDTLSRYIGYLPQDVGLFAGSITENIARLAMDPDPRMVVEAAKKAGAHRMILDMPLGYDTRLPQGAGRLSGGQRQRIGLARAAYGDPEILVLDEPNSNLDAEGSEAMNETIRAMKAEGKAVVVMTHRPAAIEECDLILILDNGFAEVFGPRDEVLRQRLANYSAAIGSNVQLASS